MPRHYAAIVFGLATVLTTRAQIPGPGENVVKGEIKTAGPNDCAGLVVKVRPDEPSAFHPTAMVGPDCSFEIRAAPTGFVTLLVTNRRDELIHQMTTRLAHGGAPLEIALPPATGHRPVRGIVSAKQLAHKPPKQAMRLFKTGSEPKLLEAIAIDPDFAQAHAALGVIYAKSMRVEQARVAFERAKEAGMVSAALESNLAWALAAMQKPHEAEAAARRALAIDPRYARAHYMLGFVLAATGKNRTEALQHLKAASTEMPAASAALIKRMQ
jgi:Tfp pilus assembly protein PilF